MFIPSNIAEGYGRKTTIDYIRMLYIAYGSVCELETQILLAGDLGLIDKGECGALKKDIAEIDRMLKALIKLLDNRPLAPGLFKSRTFYNTANQMASPYPILVI